MTFKLLLVLLLFTFATSLRAMNLFGYWTESTYKKHIAFITAYTTLSFKVEQCQGEFSITAIDPCDKNNPAHRWSFIEAQKALTTIMYNAQAEFSPTLKNDIIQSKKKEYFPSPELSKKQLSISEVYNLFCAFLQWQYKEDLINHYQDKNAHNRILFNQALSNQDINQLKKIEPEKIDFYELDRVFRKSIQDYVYQETDKISAAVLVQPQQSNWFEQTLNYFIPPH